MAAVLPTSRGVLDVDWGAPLVREHGLADGLILLLLGVPYLASPRDTNATHGTWADLSSVAQAGVFTALGSGLPAPLLVGGLGLPPGLLGVNFRGAASNRYGIRPAAAHLDGATRFTLAVWLRAGLASASGIDYCLTWPNASGGNGVDLHQNGTWYRASCQTTGSDATPSNIQVAVPDTTLFHRLVLTFDMAGDGLVLFLDGVQRNQTSVSFGTVTAAYQACFLGNFSDGFNAPWTGAIAAALTWRDRTLTAGEVAALDAEMQGGFPTLLRRVPSGLVWPVLLALAGGGGTPMALSGTLAGSSTLSGHLAGALALSGPLSAQSSLSGWLPGPVTLSGSLSATSTLRGDLRTVAALRGTLAAQSTLSGALALAPLQLIGAVPGQGVLVAALTGVAPPAPGRLPAPYAAALARPGYRPVYLVELVHANRYLATRPWQSGGPWRCGDGLVSGAPQATSGGQRPAYAATLASLGTLSVEADDQGRARVGNTTIELLNQDLAAGQLSEQLVLEHTLVRILQTFDGLGYDDAVPLMTGVIDRAEATWDALRLDVVDGSFRKHRNLSTPVGGQYFPGTPRENRGTAIPLLFGRNVGVRPIQVTGDAAGSLAFAMTASQDFCDLTEFDAPFPPTGEISIGSESGITYSSRRLVTVAGITYLRLGGLTRPAGTPGATTHAAQETVTLTSVVYTYLIGYSVSELLGVRDGGVLVDAGTYTFTARASGADRPVALLRFTTAPTDLTVDVQDDPGAAIGLTNGSFETGDGTGWTAADASLSVTSGDTAEGLDTYKAALTGDTEDTDGTLTQTFPVRQGALHVLSLWYRDPVETPNELTNGLFTPDLTGWTIGHLDAGASIDVGHALFAPIAAGDSLVMRGGQASGYRAEIYQDLTLSPGHLYRVEAYGFSWTTTSSMFQWGQTAWFALLLGTPSEPQRFGLWETIWPRVGSPGPSVYAEAPYALWSEGLLVDALLYEGRYAWVPRAGGTWLTFTPDTTTVRLTVRGRAVGTIPAAPGIELAPQLQWYSLRLAEVTDAANSPRITSGYALGPPTDPTALSVTLPQARAWRRTSARFVPTAPTMQLALRTQWHTLQQPSQYDRVTVQLGRVNTAGRHPIDVMAALAQTFLPALQLDLAAFTAARAALVDWQVGAFLPEPGGSRALLETLGTQCKTRVFENVRGELSLSVYDETRPAGAALATDALEEDAALLTVERATVDTVYTTINVWWGKLDAQAGQEPRNYQSAAYAHPAGTSSPDAGLSTRCLLAQRRYRRSQTLDVFADFIRDADTAHRLLAHLVEVHTVLRRTITCTTWLQAAPLELYDVVDLQHPVVAGGRVLTCEVRGKRVHPAQHTVELTLVELRPGDVDEAWDYDVVTFDDVPVDEEWEQ